MLTSVNVYQNVAADKKGKTALLETLAVAELALGLSEQGRHGH
jgi:hypothetical protein